MPILTAAFLATFPLVVLSGNDDPARLPQMIWLEVAVLLGWTQRLATTGNPRLPWRIFQPLVVWVAWAIASTSWAIDAFSARQAASLWAAAAGLTLWIAHIGTGKAARSFFAALFAGSVAVSIVGILQYGGGMDLIPQAFPPAGTLANKNVAAAFVVSALPAGGFLFLTQKNETTLLGIAMAFAVALAFVFHTGCRSAWLSLVAQGGLAVAVIARGLRTGDPSGSRRRAVFFGAGCLVSLTSLKPTSAAMNSGGADELLLGAARPVARLFSESSPTETHEEARPPERRAERSVDIRLGVWSNTLQMIRAEPLIGVGAGNFPVHYPRFAGRSRADGTAVDQRVESAHNDLLQLAAELGFVGALLLGWLAVSVVQRVARTAWNRTGGEGLLALCCGIGLTGILVGAVVSPTVGQPASLVAGATFLGILMREDHKRLAEETHTLGSRLALAATAACLVIVSVGGLAQIQADRHVLRMALAESEHDDPGVIREGLMARQLNPGRVDSRFATASALLRLGRPEDAGLLLGELTATEPFNANALGNLAFACAAGGDFDRAALLFERVLELRPDDRIASEQLQWLRATAPRNPVPRRTES